MRNDELILRGRPHQRKPEKNVVCENTDHPRMINGRPLIVTPNPFAGLVSYTESAHDHRKGENDPSAPQSIRPGLSLEHLQPVHHFSGIYTS